MSLLGSYARPVTHRPAPTPEQTLHWMAKFIRQGQYDHRLRELVEREIVADLFPHDYLSEYAAILNWVRSNIRYVRDPRTVEQVKTPQVVVETRTGDCLPLDTKVVVRDSRGYYRLKSLGELRHDYASYDALSYDFEQQSWTFQPVVGWHDKGVQETYRVKLTTGYSFRCTHGHKLFLWKQSHGISEVRTLADACARSPQPDGSFKLKQNWTILTAKQIPLLGQEHSFASPDAAWTLGAYVAEGWGEQHKVCIARNEPKLLHKALDRLGVPYVFVAPRPNSGGYTRLHAHPFKDALRTAGGRALDKHFPWDVLSGDAASLRKLLDGYSWGDSWHNDGRSKGHAMHVRMHSTVSSELAVQLKFLHLLFGLPLSGGGRPVPGGGLGKNLIYRLYESTGARYQERLPGLTNVGARRVAYAGTEPVCDISVANTHNFVLADGTLVHNCDDLSVVIGTLVGLVGGPVRLVAGGLAGAPRSPSGRPLLSHVWLEAYDSTSKSWVVLDPVPGRKVDQMLRRMTHRKVQEVLS